MKRIFAALAILALSVAASHGQALVTSGSAIQLTWTAPASSPDPVAGYNVYRSLTNAFNFALLNAAPTRQLSYLDAAAAGGSTYDYIVESVDANGVVSAPTNIATATAISFTGSLPVPAQPTVTVTQ